MEFDPLYTPTWHSSWKDFVIKLQTNFGPANPIRMAEMELRHLSMNHDTHLTEYLVRFNTLAARVRWGDAALRFQFYDGLPNCLKDRIAILGKPDTLRELVQVTQRYNILYWERMEERRFTQRKESRPAPNIPRTSGFRQTAPSSQTSQHPSNLGRQNNQQTPRPHDRFLGPNGKLKPEEVNRRRENNLCAMCGKADHKITTCPSASRVRASILQTENATEIPTENMASDSRQENDSATLHVQRR